VSNRRAKRERSEIRNRGRLRYLLAVLELEDLQRVGVVPNDYIEKPNSTAIERMLDERLKTFLKADSRLRRREPARERVASVFKKLEVHKVCPAPLGKHVTGFTVDELREITAETER
jgi:hypothetical protein